MKSSLIIGKTSQLAYYFPENYEKISSRNIDIEYFEFNDKFYDRIFFCFGEQRTFIENDYSIFTDINVDYTLKLIKTFHRKCNKLIIYGTSELWNNYEGGITINDPFNFNSSPYIESKKTLIKTLIDLRQLNNFHIIILYPFNFNSIYRTYEFVDGKISMRKFYSFLFSKIFDSIINKKKIEIGDTYFYRDIIHPKYVVERSILANEDEIIGSGRLVFVNDFIRDLYKNCGLNYEDYITENYDKNLKVKRKIYYLNSKQIKYNNLLNDTLDDIRFIQNKISQ